MKCEILQSVRNTVTARQAQLGALYLRNGQPVMVVRYHNEDTTQLGGGGGSGGVVQICNLRTGNMWAVSDTDVFDVPSSVSLTIAMEDNS